MSSSNKVAKATIGLMIVTLMAKVLGFARETVLVGLYGASMTSDAYLTSYNIPIVIFSTIGTAITTTFIPLYFEIERNDGKSKALKFANNIFNIAIILSIVLSILGFIFAEPLTKLFAMDFSGDKLALATSFTRTMIWSVVFISLACVMTSWLQIKGNFTVPGLISVPTNTIIIISMFLSVYFKNLTILSIGALLGMASQFIYQYPYARKLEFRYSTYLDLKDKYLKKMLILVLPVFVGVSVNQINIVVDKSLASTLGDGIITVLNSANKLNIFVQGMFIATIVSVIYPLFSKLSSEGDEEGLISAIKTSIGFVSMLILPISVGAIVLAEPVVRIVFMRGAFDAKAASLTASALAAYSVGMIGYSMRDILNRVFYSLKDTKTPMINGVLAVVTNIVFSLILIRYMGHIGPALATSVSTIVCTVLMFISLKKRMNYFGQDKIIKNLLKCLVSSIVMGIGTRYIYLTLSSHLSSGTVSDVIGLLVSVLVGVIIYGVMVVVLKVDEVSMVVDTINKKLNR